MREKPIVLILTVASGLGILAACNGGNPTGPNPPAALAFRGTITSQGAAVAGVQVFLSGDASRNVVTDINGSFSFPDVRGRSFTITPSLANHAFSPSNYTLGTQSRADLNFTTSSATYGSVVDKIAADFTAIDQNGQPVSLYAYFGKVVHLDFSADWCGPCQLEATQLEAYRANLRDRGFETITILISGPPSIWASTYGLTFPVLDDSLQTLWSIYGEGGVPLNIVLDRNMTIRYKTAGYIETEIRAAIAKYL